MNVGGNDVGAEPGRMEEPRREGKAVRLQVDRHIGQALGFHALVQPLSAQCPPWMRYPETVRAGEVFLDFLFRQHQVFGVLCVDERLLQISLGSFRAGEELAPELLIEANPVTPRRGAVDIVEKLLEAGYLRGLERLVRDQRALQHPERGSAD